MRKEICLSHNNCLHSAKETLRQKKNKERKEWKKETNKKEKKLLWIKFCNNMIFACIVLLSWFLKRLQHWWFLNPLRLAGKPFQLPAGVTLFKILVTSSALIFRPCSVKVCSLFLICFCNDYWREWEVKTPTPKASRCMWEKDLWYPGQHACIHVFRKIIIINYCLLSLGYCSRADTFLRRGTGDVSMIEESQNLSLFLANQNKITFLLKEGLETIQGYEDVLADVLNQSVRLHESNMYITPTEKHLLLKVCYSQARSSIPL